MADSILLIDDETQFLATMGKRLRKRGFLVREAGSGLEGLRELELEPPMWWCLMSECRTWTAFRSCGR